jgi:hypothetical protein
MLDHEPVDDLRARALVGEMFRAWALAEHHRNLRSFALLGRDDDLGPEIDLPLIVRRCSIPREGRLAHLSEG